MSPTARDRDLAKTKNPRRGRKAPAASFPAKSHRGRSPSLTMGAIKFNTIFGRGEPVPDEGWTATGGAVSSRLSFQRSASGWHYWAKSKPA